MMFGHEYADLIYILKRRIVAKTTLFATNLIFMQTYPKKEKLPKLFFIVGIFLSILLLIFLHWQFGENIIVYLLGFGVLVSIWLFVIAGLKKRI